MQHVVSVTTAVSMEADLGTLKVTHSLTHSNKQQASEQRQTPRAGYALIG